MWYHYLRNGVAMLNFCLHMPSRTLDKSLRIISDLFQWATVASSTETMPSPRKGLLNTLIVEYPWCTLSEIDIWRQDAIDPQVILVVDAAHQTEALHACNCGFDEIVFDDERFEMMLKLALNRTARAGELTQKLSAGTAECQRLNEARQLRRNFLCKATHDLRTPLVSMQIYAQFLVSGRLGPISDLQKEKAESILHNGERLIHCIESINRFERLDSGCTDLVRSRFDLRDILNEAISGVTRACMQKGITLGHSWPSDPLMISADYALILEVIRNLIENAIEATEEKGSITLAITRREGSRASISITDTGSGIDPQVLGKLINGTLDDALRLGHPGLGLQSARHILELHGSRLEMDSQKERGTRVRFTLPVSTERVIQERNFVADSEERKRVVLVVDDDEDNLTCTRSVLEFAGYEVLSAGSFTEARAQLEDGRVDAILLDIAMDGVNGLDILRRLKHYPSTSVIPVLMVSASADNTARVEAAQLGAAAFVVKPFMPARLLKELRAAMVPSLVVRHDCVDG